MRLWCAFVAFIGASLICGYVDNGEGIKNSDSENEMANILLINIDDLGWTDLGFMGSNYYETPNIDQLAAQGMIFSNAYASAANCSPSRAALFTGKYAPRTGVYTVNNSDRGNYRHRKLIPTENTKFIDKEDLTVADILQDNGYKTAHVGKWHISRDPIEHGFDVNIGGLEAGSPAWGDMRGYFAPFDNPNIDDSREDEYLTDRLTKEAISFLKKVDESPFFMNYSPYIVHTPIQPKEELEDKYKDKEKGERHFNAGYAAMVETMDRNIGRIVGYLKQSDKYENTVIIFTSDNGGLYRVSRQWPLRAGKGSYYEGGIRVPLIIVWPGKVKAGSTYSQPVSNIDFFPTFMDVAGIEKYDDKELDGVSLIPIFDGGDISERPLFWHFPIYLQTYNGEQHQFSDPHFRTRPGSVIRKGAWKLHEYFEDGRLELYNLETDIQERRDLSGIFPGKTQELYRLLENWRSEIGAPIPDQVNPDYINDSD